MIEEVELIEEETYPIEKTYPVQATRPRQYARRTPYQKTVPEVVIETPKKPTVCQQLNKKDWDEAYQRTISPSPEVQMKEPEEKKPHKVKEFKFDPWADLKA